MDGKGNREETFLEGVLKRCLSILGNASVTVKHRRKQLFYSRIINAGLAILLMPA